MKGKKFRQPRGVTVVLGNSIAKDVKGCELQMIQTWLLENLSAEIAPVKLSGM